MSWATLLLINRRARSVCCVACALSWATWLLFTGVLALCCVLCVRYPGPLGSCSAVRPLGGSRPVCGVLDLVFTGVLARWIVLRVRYSGSLGSCSPVCGLGALCCLYGVLGHLAPVHRCARSVHCVARAVSWATWLLYPGLLARLFLFCVRCPGPLGSCSPVCLLGVLCRVVLSRVRCQWPIGSCSPVCSPAALRCVCGVLRLLASVQQCACSLRCVACVQCP